MKQKDREKQPVKQDSASRSLTSDDTDGSQGKKRDWDADKNDRKK